ncbi:co-chaperone GroES [bacterium]|nr:co-chaperone GroES [bacterium]
MRPTGKAVCILPDGNPDKTDSGIIVPQTMKEQPNSGVIVSAGPATEQVKVGDHVMFPRKSGSSIMLDDVEHLLVTEDKIQFIY